MQIVYSLLVESMVGIVTRLWAGEQWNDALFPSKDKRFLFFSEASGLSLGPTLPPIQWAPVAFLYG
jgi:hypothetical protein